MPRSYGVPWYTVRMTFRRDAVALILSAIALVIVAMTFSFDALVGGMTKRVEREQYELMEAIVTFNLRGVEDRALSRAEMLANLTSVRDAFERQDRAALHAETRETFRVQRGRHGVDQGQFYTLAATSFLRMHDPNRHGDSVASFRPMVVATNRDGVPRKGMAISRRGPAIFGITPIRNAAGQQIGSVELGMNPGPTLDRLKAAYELELSLFIDEGRLRETATDLRGEVFNDRNRVGRYIKVHATNWRLMRALVDAERLVPEEDPVRYSREIDGTAYGVSLLPVRNSFGDAMGVIAVARDFSASRAAINRARLWQGLIAVLAVVLLCGIVIVVVRGLVVKPLAAINDGLSALARGDASVKIDDRKMNAEMARAARSYEELRSKMEERS